MDNCFTGLHDRSHQMTEKAVLCYTPAGPVWYCAFARWRRQRDIASFFNWCMYCVEVFLRNSQFLRNLRFTTYYEVGCYISLLSPASRAGDYKMHSVRVLLSVCHAFIKGCTSHWLFLLVILLVSLPTQDRKGGVTCT